MLYLIFGKLCGQYFDRSIGAKVNMLTQVDLGETSLAKQFDEMIAAKLSPLVLPLLIGHVYPSLETLSPRSVDLLIEYDCREVKRACQAILFCVQRRQVK